MPGALFPSACVANGACLLSLWLDSRYLALLGRKVAARPDDLESHVRRILLRTEDGNPTAIFLALVDLFGILGARGESLRSNLLRFAGARLSREQREHLMHLAANSHYAGRKCANAFMGYGEAEDTVIVRMQGRPAEAEKKEPLAEAQLFLEHGQFGEACEVLFNALLAKPDDAAVSKELLKWYVHARDARAIGRVLEHFGERSFACRDEWRQAECGIDIP